jgi:hypothetical protein
MNRLSASLGSILFLIIAPGTVAGLVPWWITRWTRSSAFADNLPLDIVAFVLIAGGLAVLLDSFARALPSRDQFSSSSPRKRGPIILEDRIGHARAVILIPVFMGPRFRGDDVKMGSDHPNSV